MASSSSSASGSAPLSAKNTTDPILRNALRYTISAQEYETLHKYIISRSRLLKRNAPSVARVERLIARPQVGGRRREGEDGKMGVVVGDDYNAAAVRESLRVFMGTAVALKAWDVIGEKVLGRRKSGKQAPFYKNPNFRLSLSLSTILLLHRILFRFFTRLRSHLLTASSAPFRKRNKRTSKTLTSPYAPAIGASLAGFMLAVYPADQLRVTVAIYALTRAAEFAYNLAESEGWIWNKVERPWWWGSWLLFPLTSGQLLSAFTFDRDCFPKPYGEFILKYSPVYLQLRPEDYPANLSWPSKYTIVDSLAQISRLNFPPFTSPILFPNSDTLPQALKAISPITSPAHPLITSLTCATLHPSDPSCSRTYVTYLITVFPRLARFFTVVFTILSLPTLITRPSKILNSPISFLNKLAGTILRYSTFVAGSVGTSWGSICLFQSLFPRNFLPEKRWFLGGMLGGLWAWVVRRQARGEFLYAVRASLLSLWQVGRKRGVWKGVKGGDVAVFVASLMVIETVFERNREAVNSGVVRRVMGGARGEGWGDSLGSKEEEGKEK